VQAILEALDAQLAAAERVMQRLTVLRLLCATGEDRFASHATEELEAALDRLACAELARATAVAEVTGDADTTLATIAEVVDEPTAATLRARGERLRATAREFEQLRRVARHDAGRAHARTVTHLEGLLGRDDAADAYGGESALPAPCVPVRRL
jgi:hypothetical protein